MAKLMLSKYLVIIDMTSIDGFEFGYPPYDKAKWFGLWSPVLNCFVLVHYDLDFLQKIKILGTSKIMLNIVELPPELYTQNKIDNQCCERWTIESIESVNFSSPYDIDLDISRVSICPIEPHPDATKIKNWFIFLLRWTRVLEFQKNIYKTFLEEIISYQEPDPSVVPDIYKLLWLGENIDETESKIKNILEKSTTTETQNLLSRIKWLS